MAARGAALLAFLVALVGSAQLPQAAVQTTHRHSLGTSTPEEAHRADAAAMHIVLAMHQEDANEVEQYVAQLMNISAVAAARPRIYVYVKGGPIVALQLRQRGFAHSVIELPNIGREQETYLRHIVAHYDSLPRHVLFSQALPNWEEMLLGRLQTFFGPRTGVLGLGLVAVCTCEGHSSLWPEYGAGGFIRLREVWALAQGTLCPHEFACFHNGFLVASRTRLHLQHRRLYKYLLNLFTTPPDDPLRVDEHLYKHVRSRVEAEWPTFGHVVERSWNALLNCTDTDVARTCPESCEEPDCTELEQCQCLDEALPHSAAELEPL